MEIENSAERQNKKPFKIKLNEWFSPFQKSEDLPGIGKEVEIPFILDGYGLGEVSMLRDLNFSMENTGDYWLMKPGNKSLTLTIDVKTSNSGKKYWRLDGKRTPMMLHVNLENIPRGMVHETRDRYKRPYLTAGLKCFLEIPLHHNKFVFCSDSNVYKSTTVHEHADDTVELKESFGARWKNYSLPAFKDSLIYFPDNDPELFKQIRIKFEKTRIRKPKEINDQKLIENER